MLMTAFLFGSGLLLSAVAAFYSITGLAYLFSGAFYPILIMGIALEGAKLIGASWVFRSWRTASKLLLGYVTTAVLVLMLLTGIGIFGYLSRAYLVQQAPLTQLAAEVASTQQAYDLARAQYEQDVKTLQSAGTSTNAVVQKMTELDRVTGAVSVLRSQQTLQRELQARVTASSAALTAADKNRANAKAMSDAASVDVGPLMFAAKAWYGRNDTATMDRVVTWFICLILMVFDPMAIALLLAAQSTTRQVEVSTDTPTLPDYSTLRTYPEEAPTPTPVDEPHLLDDQQQRVATFEPIEIVEQNSAEELPINTGTVELPPADLPPYRRPSSRRTGIAPKR